MGKEKGNSMDLLTTIIVMAVLMLIGWLIARIGLVKEEDTRAIANLLISVTTPALIIRSVTTHFTREMLFHSLSLPFMAMLMITVAGLWAYIFSFIVGCRRTGYTDVFILSSSFANTLYLGIPVIVSLYGEQATGLIFVYDLGAALLAWSWGVYLAQGERRAAGFKLGESFKHFLNPPFLALFFSALLVIAGWKLPAVLLEASKLVGDITVPLSMLFIGISVAYIPYSRYNLWGAISAVVLIRLVLTPLTMFLVLQVIGIPVLFKKVVLMEAAMPTMLSVAVLARKYGNKYEFVATAALVTTVVSLVTIPLMAWLIERYI